MCHPVEYCRIVCTFVDARGEGEGRRGKKAPLCAPKRINKWLLWGDYEERFRDEWTQIHATYGNINCLYEKADISDISRIPRPLRANTKASWMKERFASLPRSQLMSKILTAASIDGNPENRKIILGPKLLLAMGCLKMGNKFAFCSSTKGS